MRKNWLFSLLAVGLLAGCISMPRETASLTVQLGNQIVESKVKNLELIDEWAKQRRSLAEQFLQYRWIPTFIMNFMDENGAPYKNLKEVMKNDCRRDKADEVQAIVEAISTQIEKKRLELLNAIDEQVYSLKDVVGVHNATTEKIYRTILANIQSVSKGLEWEKDIRDAMLKPLKEIAPINAASKKLDELLKGE